MLWLIDAFLNFLHYIAIRLMSQGQTRLVELLTNPQALSTLLLPKYQYLQQRSGLELRVS